MNWTPTEAMKRAQALMLDMQASAAACGIETASSAYPMYHARVFDMIVKAIDQAFVDGSEMDALNAVVGNGAITEDALAAYVMPLPYRVAPSNPEHPQRGLEPDLPSPEPKKRAGRPKGSGKKAKKTKGKAEELPAGDAP